MRYFWLALLIGSLTVSGDEPALPTGSEGGVAFFESRIRPALAEHCYRCHGKDVQKAGLRVDLRDAIRRGGTSGAAVVPGRPEASLLLSAISHAADVPAMPPRKSQLSGQWIADVRQWIADGAVDPRVSSEGSAVSSSEWRVPEAKDHWAYRAAESVAVPDQENDSWSIDQIDRFVLRALDRQGLEPTTDAAPQTLLRRISFDLIGLPPTPDELDQFIADQKQHGTDSALAGAADRMIQSEHFGERWGRHWLDVVRFGESSGGESNISFPHAWRYRDYVIDAFNADLSLDRFLTEQVAGDLLPTTNDVDRERLLIATGYLAVGTKNLGENDVKRFEADLVDEQIDALTRSLLASSVACARCHDHKFDPFSMQDYYALAGVFASTKTFFGTATSPANIRSGDPLVLPRRTGQKIFNRSFTPEKFSELKSQFETLDRERSEIRASQAALFGGKKPDRLFTLREVLANTWRLGGVEGKLETVDESGQALPLAMGVLDREIPVDSPLYETGDLQRPGELVARDFPASMGLSGEYRPPAAQSGRLELARWLTDPRHPLTARVYVNRIWGHLFGQGIVATVDDFGTTGALPSHPELLNYLALEFVRDGWSTKRLVRRLVLTRTYRQASAVRLDAFEADPDNRWLWRMPKRRLQAEALRDGMLAVSGDLDRTRPGGSLVATRIGDRPISLIGLNKRLPADLDGATYRSVYLPVIRDRLPPVLELFDFAEPSLVSGKRENTNVPMQALYLMNSEFVIDRAQGLAERCFGSAGTERDAVTHAFRLCFGRAPQAAELQRSLDFLSDATAGIDQQKVRLSFCQGLLSTAEFRNLD